ncbi:MAG: sodium/solute symporter [Ignavibacteriales bacterium]|nr:sodium/solute symporter [Ignavibacteriales bacterium]MBK7979862.1 sodium/solute symporter [Ignavibacteriota bacterium]
MSGNLNILDNLIILIYFAVVLAIGLYYGRSKGNSVFNYFLAGKNLTWIIIGTSLFATNISSEHFVGLAGAGSVHGLSVGYFEWLAILILFLLGWLFAPIFLRANIQTVPQYFGKRFDNRSRFLLTVVSVLSYIFTKIGVTLLAATFVLKQVLGWDVFTSTIIIIFITGLYTVIGGLTSVTYTQVFQTVMLILGAVLLSIFGLSAVGGLGQLVEKLPADYFSIFKSGSDADVPWTGIIFGAPIIGIWYWCADQYIVQRVLAAKGIEEVKKGTMLAAFFKIFPILFLIFPGLIAAVLYPDSKGDTAYSLLLTGDFLPIGIKGLVITGFFAALMSSLSSSFNSAASLISLDVYQMFRKNYSDRELVLVGRLSTMIFIILAIAIVPFTKLFNIQIYLFLQTIQSFIAPPIVSVLLIGVFWKKANSNAAYWTLIIGGFIGFLKMTITVLDQQIVSNIGILKFLYNINFLHFTFILFFISSTIMVGISLFSSELNNDYEAVKELTVFEEKLKTDFASNSISKILK